MGNEKIRLLRAEEIECRIATINEQGISILLYKDARVDQRILDETFGLFGWKRSHQCINENLYCNNRFSVSSIGYNADREIASLTVVNKREPSYTN